MKMLSTKYCQDNEFEIGIDEAGRGPLFGRLYVAAVLLPKDPSAFEIPDIKDSKKIKNKKKLRQLSDFIKENAESWSIQYIEHDEIDAINIRQAVLKAMHLCVADILKKQIINPIINKTFLLIDGNDFKPYCIYDNIRETLYTVPYTTIERGDNTYSAIAAASILAKCARDSYIEDLCERFPALCEFYKLNSNMGYGTKAHLEGIETHGITPWHRITYSRCKGKPVNSSFANSHLVELFLQT